MINFGKEKFTTQREKALVPADFSRDNKFMKFVYSIIVSIVAILMTSCTAITMQKDWSTFLPEFNDAVSMQSRELAISKLRSIQAPDEDSRIKVQASITYLSLYEPDTSFTAEADRLSALVSRKKLHELSQPIQTLLYLNYKVQGDSAGESALAINTIREAVDQICDADARFGLEQRIDDIAALNSRMFTKYLTSACASLIRDENKEVTKYVNLAIPIARYAPMCRLALGKEFSSPESITVAWLECKLYEAGVALNPFFNRGIVI